MSLPTERFPTLLNVSVGDESGGSSRGGVAALDPHREFMRECPACGRHARFIAEIELANGLYVTCIECGDQRVVPYTRTISEL